MSDLQEPWTNLFSMNIEYRSCEHRVVTASTAIDKHAPELRCSHSHLLGYPRCVFCDVVSRPFMDKVYTDIINKRCVHLGDVGIEKIELEIYLGLSTFIFVDGHRETVRKEPTFSWG